jgi:GT2 family glycosyltransferase
VPTVDRGSVRIVTLYDDEHGFSPNYVQSLLAMIGHDLVGQQRIARGGWSLKHAKSYDIAAARNEATAEFLESDVEWMLFVDSDMGWEADALERLFDSADANLRPIVGGLCFGYSPVETGAGEANGPFRYPFPTLYWFNETETDIGFQVMWNYRAGALNPVKATGAAFLLIHRGALETMRATHGDTWWSRIKHPKAQSMWGEDTSFCARVGLCDIPVFVDTRIRTSHLKPIYVSEVAFASQIQAPSADEEVDVIVPVLGRPHHAAPFMRSLRATTGLAHVTAVATEDDTEAIAAWQAAGAEVLITDPERTTFAQKVNDAYDATDRPWLLLVGSDVLFRPAWWDHALSVAQVHGASVVATNDVLNDDVRNGRLATHPVMRRSYIDECGASWDGPGLIAHEGYTHWYVDAEWSTVALSRGVMVTALGAVVEHLHPISGKAPMDAVYELGQKHRKSDAALFESRCKRYANRAVAA